MNYEIDQSGRIEYTTHDSVIAFGNGHSKAILISKREKRILQGYFRRANKPTMFVLQTFSTLIFLLIKDDLDHIGSLIIDEEYEGRHNIIKKYLLQILKQIDYEFDPKRIHFACIGKKSSAHKKAISVFRKKQKADIVVTSKDVLKWVEK